MDKDVPRAQHDLGGVSKFMCEPVDTEPHALTDWIRAVPTELRHRAVHDDGACNSAIASDGEAGSFEKAQANGLKIGW